MKVVRLTINNFRGIRKAVLHFEGHTLLVGANNVGKSTICEALDLVLGPDRLNRFPVVDEYDFHNAVYVAQDGSPVPMTIEVVLTDLTPDVLRRCANNMEFWNKAECRLLGEGEIQAVDAEQVVPCLRIVTVVLYDSEEDEFEARTCYAHSPEAAEGKLTPLPKEVKRSFGFLYLRALRTGARALTLERGSLLDIILRLKAVRVGLWEESRRRLRGLDPPIDKGSEDLGPILEAIEERLGEYIPLQHDTRATQLFVSQLTREHLRKTITFFLSLVPGQEPVPFYKVGSGTLNMLVLALLSFIAEIKKDNVIFAMEEPEIALPPHTQRRIAKYLRDQTTQCFVTSHSPYVIERFDPQQIIHLSHDEQGVLVGTALRLPPGFKAKTYRSQLRRAIAEAMLSRGVIVGEGLSEQLALQVTANKLELADTDLFPFDVAGVSIVSSDGEGNLSDIGAFFGGLGVQSFAFYDNRARKTEENQLIRDNFTVCCEIPYKGIEALLAAEIPLDRQWASLEGVRATDENRRFGIPNERPADNVIRQLSEATLRGTKGEGGAAMLIEQCCADELPPTITEFLMKVYRLFPRPKRSNLAASDPAVSAESRPTVRSAESEGAKEAEADS
jgi:putative ATP-dependent endonuclease of OLD family